MFESDPYYDIESFDDYLDDYGYSKILQSDSISFDTPEIRNLYNYFSDSASCSSTMNPENIYETHITDVSSEMLYSETSFEVPYEENVNKINNNSKNGFSFLNQTNQAISEIDDLQQHRQNIYTKTSDKPTNFFTSCFCNCFN